MDRSGEKPLHYQLYWIFWENQDNFGLFHFLSPPLKFSFLEGVNVYFLISF